MRSDQYEQELEYERLCGNLKSEAAGELALALHAAHEQLIGGSKLIHLYAVANLAQQLAEAFYSETDFHAQRYWKLSCYIAGLLHEAMICGGTFEMLVAVSDETVARMVGCLTPDNRIPAPRRLSLLSNQIGLGGAPVQLVKLADMQHDCFQLLGYDLTTLDDNLLSRVDNWLSESRSLLRNMFVTKESDPLQDEIADFHVQLSDLATRLDVAWKRPFRRRKR
jgi:hypothetical protein